jgi:NADPH2:quinone reductase
MRAIRVSRHGEPEVLVLEDVPRPEPRAGEVLVRIAAAGVNFADVYARRGGGALPFIPGLEASGVIEALGSGVGGFEIGDRVASARAPASYAEYACVGAEQLLRLPPDISFEVGAAFPLQGLTAHYLVHDFRRLRAGDTVLVHAAAGGVGLLVVQLAKHIGARVIGTVSTAEKAAIARLAGADEVILYTQRDFVDDVRRITRNDGVDLVVDGVGKATFPGDLQAARTRGHVVVFGAASGAPDPVAPSALMARSLTVSGGSPSNHVATHDELTARAGELLRGIREGWIRIRIDRTLPLGAAARAQELLENRKTSGKVLLLP